MAQALYRKWRPQTFDEVVDQHHVTQTLRNALADGRVTHAYLFAGSRGTGKTSVARILAKAVNCTGPGDARPCNVCPTCRSISEGRCLDLIEIDAASNRGIDEIRDLREKVHFSPGEAKYKFYVIDECFRYEDLITLADGSKLPIGKIVEAGLPVEVLSYNERTHRIEPKPVIRHMRKRPELPMMRITFDNNRALVCTLNHKFYTPNGQIRAGELEVGQFVYAGYESITQHQLAVIAGAALGDGHISLTGSQMRARLSITQGVAQDGTLGGLAVSIVRSIERVPPAEFVYNIEVADNHNYFARDILVANCHMLTNEAFNALLKTLEEPPPHVMFVLATTEPHRIPATILSRCQRFDFRRIKVKDIVDHLSAIAAQEKLQIEGKALQLIARQSTGSMRDAISLLDQLVAFGGDEVTLDRVQALLGAVSAEVVEGLVDCLIQRDLASGLRLINQVVDDGLDPRQLNRQLLEHLRGLLLIQFGGDTALDVTDEALEQMRAQVSRLPRDQLVEIIKLFNTANQEMRGSLQIQLPLELAFVEAVMKCESGQVRSERTEPQSPVTAAPPASGHQSPVTTGVKAPVRAEPPAALRESPATTTMEEAGPLTARSGTPAKAPPQSGPGLEPGVPSSPEGTAQPQTLEQIVGQWPRLLAAVKPRNRNVEALLKDSQPVAVEGNTLVLGFFYSFHKERLEEARAKSLVEQVLSQVMGQSYRIRCVLTPKTLEEIERERPKNKFEEAAQDPVVQAAVKLGGRIADVRMPSEDAAKSS